MTAPRVAAYVFVAVLCGSMTKAHGDTCDPKPLRAQLEHEHGKIAKWRWGWAAGFGVAAIGQLTIAQFLDDRERRDTMYVGAGKATIGFLSRVILPPKVPVPDENPDACEDVKQLRAALAIAGRKERSAFWLNHLGGFAVNAGGAAILVYRDSWKAGLISFALGFPVGLASTYTMSRWAWHAWRDDKSQGVGVTTSF